MQRWLISAGLVGVLIALAVGPRAIGREAARLAPPAAAAVADGGGGGRTSQQAVGAVAQPDCAGPAEIVRRLGAQEFLDIPMSHFCPGMTLDVCVTTPDAPAELILYRQPGDELISAFIVRPETTAGTFQRCEPVRVGGRFLQFVALRGAWQVRIARPLEATDGPSVTSITPNWAVAGGTRGTPVTITGSGFSTAPGATQFGEFDGIQFTDVVCASSTRCTATVPPANEPPGGAFAINVFATVNGQTSSGDPAVDFTWIGTPNLVSLSPGSGPAAGGTTVTIVGGVFPVFASPPAPTTVRFGNAPPVTVQCTDAHTCTVQAPPGTGTVMVTVTTPAGASNALPFLYLPSVPQRPTPAPIPIPLDPR